MEHLGLTPQEIIKIFRFPLNCLDIPRILFRILCEVLGNFRKFPDFVPQISGFFRKKSGKFRKFTESYRNLRKFTEISGKFLKSPEISEKFKDFVKNAGSESYWRQTLVAKNVFKETRLGGDKVWGTQLEASMTRDSHASC